MSRLVLLIIATVTLTGCQTTTPAPEVRVELVERHIPATLLHCRGEPRPPAKPASQGQAARYVLDLAEAGRDCRSKLGAVRAEVERQRAAQPVNAKTGGSNGQPER